MSISMLQGFIRYYFKGPIILGTHDKYLKVVSIYNNTTATQHLESISGEKVRKQSEDRPWENV